MVKEIQAKQEQICEMIPADQSPAACRCEAGLIEDETSLRAPGGSYSKQRRLYTVQNPNRKLIFATRISFDFTVNAGV